MIRKASTLIALSVLLLPACKKDKDDKNNNAIEEIPTSFVGNYKTDCVANSVLGLSHTIRTIDIKPTGGFTRTEDYFGSDQCQDKGLSLRVEGTAQEKGKLPQDPKLDMLNFSVSEAYITVDNDTLLKTLNATKFCGISDWALNQEREVSGKECQGFVIRKGDVIPEVVDDREGTLYFGKKFALLLNETGDRPTEIDEDIPYHKQ